MSYKYKHGVLGGTFDHLHAGHKYLLDAAFTLSEKVTVGLATEKIYSQKYLAYLIENYESREEQIKKYFSEKGYSDRAEIVTLNDIYGPAVDSIRYNAIFVTQTTLPNARKINEFRNNKNIFPLEIITIPFKHDETGKVIASERIRLGEIDREGHVYVNVFKDKNKLILPNTLRNELRQPIGELLKNAEKIKKDLEEKTVLISVGDIVTKSLKDVNCIPHIEILDFKTRRHALDKDILNSLKKTTGSQKFTNEPGSIYKEVVIAYKEAIKRLIDLGQKQIIIVEGEEDLLTLPAVLLAPLGSIVCYGQFDLNAMVEVFVTEEKKKIIYNLLQQFE